MVLPTIEEIAKLAGVSKTTVSLALSDHPRISEQTKRKIREIAEQIHYVPNRLASGLSSSRSKMIALVCYTQHLQLDGLFAELLTHISQESLKAGYSVVLLASTEEHGDELADKLRYAGVEGAIILSWSAKITGLKKLLQARCPLVFLGQRKVEGLPASEMNIVATDSYNGSREAVEYLVSLGHRQIGLIVPFESERIPAIEERIRGYKSVMDELGQPYSEQIFELPVTYNPEHPCWNQIQRSPCTAYFSSSMREGRVLLQYFQQAGVSVPGDVSLIVFDDFPTAALEHPPVTVLKQDARTLGRMACNVLIDLLEHPDDQPKRLFVPPVLVLRESAAAVKETRNG
ncbi:LacI family DNA-binding transcriptional regulator [Gorillibacterium sp. sgz5001074]|uniref:LacI family DNA-binding transcriptional regulator n=1 Tax=Gorillibacterium sp. sgz5001074 TaxID=3446695 RepID=UPI003F66A345